jgi:hypothetical protein
VISKSHFSVPSSQYLAGEGARLLRRARDCQIIVVHTGGVRRIRNRGTATALFRSQVSGVRSGSPASGPATLLVGGAVRGHLGQSVRPCFLPFTLHRPPPFPKAFTSPWGSYSTPARCGCQELIPIYCIPKQLTEQMRVLKTKFSTRPLNRGGIRRLLEGLWCVALVAWEPLGAADTKAKSHPLGPSPRKCPRKSRGAECCGGRRMTPPGNRRSFPDVRVRVHPRT